MLFGSLIQTKLRDWLQTSCLSVTQKFVFALRKRESKLIDRLFKLESQTKLDWSLFGDIFGHILTFSFGRQVTTQWHINVSTLFQAKNCRIWRFLKYTFCLAYKFSVLLIIQFQSFRAIWFKLVSGFVLNFFIFQNFFCPIFWKFDRVRNRNRLTSNSAKLNVLRHFFGSLIWASATQNDWLISNFSVWIKAVNQTLRVGCNSILCDNHSSWNVMF